MWPGTFKCKKPNPRYAVSSLKKGAKYTPDFFGFKPLSGDGRNIKICVIDSGSPNHRDIKKINANRINDFSQKDKDGRDIYGHATGVGGILCADNPSGVVGLVPSADMYYAKALADHGTGNFDAVISAILWSIVQQVHIIVLSMGSQSHHQLMYDVIKKAHESGIAIFAAAGNHASKTKDADYPARFSEVMSVEYIREKSNNKVVSSGPTSIAVHADSLYTAYGTNQYIKMSGSSVAAPVVAGVAARIIQKNSMLEYSPDYIYSALTSWIRK